MRKKGIRLETAIEPLLLDVDIMIPLGLILNELISNALKYAFSDGRNGELLVKLSRQNEEIKLLVADDGIGLPESFNLEVTSMGYTLVQDFCRKLKAILNIASENGTKITLSIPTIQTIR